MLEVAIERLRDSEEENKVIWADYQVKMDNAHDQNKEIRSIIERKQKQLCDIDTQYCEKKKTSEISRTYENIIIHHTATRSDISIEDMKASMIKTHGIIPAHYIIAKDGTREKTAELEENV